jgi:ferredoxin
MAYVVTDNCLKCRFTDCVTVCPVECFYADQEMLYIHPDECIDCAACVPVCPAQAIFWVEDLAPDKSRWEKINADRSQDEDTYNITDIESALPTATERLEELGL